jgi:hypothetical protein
MTKTLHQKTAFQIVEFTIEDSGLLKRVIKKGGMSEFNFPYEKLTSNRAFILEASRPLLGFSIFFFVLSVIVFIAWGYNANVSDSAAPFWLVVSIVLFVAYYFTRAKKVYINTTDNQPIVLYSDKPGKEEVDTFIEALMAERNTYLFSKYGQLTRHLEYAPQLENLNWLLNNKVITKSKHDEKVKELNTLFDNPRATAPIGFTSTNLYGTLLSIIDCILNHA